MTYQVPPQYYYRLHHIRPRFKNDLENVLIYVATEVCKLPASDTLTFQKKLNEKIRLFPGNATVEQKTINNWRTEISSLFGFIEIDLNNNIFKPGAIACKLANNQDLVEFFKYFLFHFQYPGGHLKPQEVAKMINIGIKFKPAKYILKLLEKGENITSNRFAITKAELTHFVFNDLRVTRDNASAEDIVKLILESRKNNYEFDWSGDVVRYAGDILDYMVIADLLKLHGNNYYINWNEREAVTAFIESEQYFDKYDNYYGKGTVVAADVYELFEDWFQYVNSNLDTVLFKTDVLKYLGIPETDYESLIQESIEELQEKVETTGEARTKDIGDIGENLIVGHECMTLKLGDRQDLIKQVKRIPNAFAIGYDIQSVELTELKKYIEVKSTISSKKINFYNFQLTKNEWNTAESCKDRYFVYRLFINKDDCKLFIIQDPVGQYKKGVLQMRMGEGADIIFKENTGNWNKLLIWQK